MMEIITGYTGEPHVRSEDMGALYAAIFGTDNFVLPIGSEFDMTFNTATQATIGSGDMLINGRHGRIRNGDTEVITFDSGTTGMKRNDLVVARYENNGTTESMTIVVIKGADTTGDPVDPDYITGNVLLGSSQADFPLYRVSFDGLNAPQITKLFNVLRLGSYSPGDTIKNSNNWGVIANGYTTTSSRQVSFMIPEKACDVSISSLIVKNLRLTLRHAGGGYPWMRNGSTYTQLGDDYVNIVTNGALASGVTSVTAAPTNGGIRVTILFDNALVTSNGGSTAIINNAPASALLFYEFTAA